MPAGVDIEAEVAGDEGLEVGESAAQREVEHIGGGACEQDEGNNQKERIQKRLSTLFRP